MTAAGETAGNAIPHPLKPFDISPRRMLGMRHQPAKARAMTSDSVVQLTPHKQRLIEASTAIRGRRPTASTSCIPSNASAASRTKTPATMCWSGTASRAMLSFASKPDPPLTPIPANSGSWACPYGEKPRLVLIHLATEAVRSGNPVVDVEDSMTGFARSLGLETNGQQLRAFKDQLARLAAATVRMGVVEEGRAVQINTQFIGAFELEVWSPKDHDQRMLWPSTVRLSQEYFQTLGNHAVPLDHRAVAALASSAMALDVYAWLAQRLHRVPTGKPQFIGWANLHQQFGQGYDRVRDFRRRFLQTLHHVHSAYPTARFDANDAGLTLSHSPPPVAPRYVAPQIT